MIKFGFGSYTKEYPNWSKHHKKISIHAKQVFDDGEINECQSEELRALVNANEGLLLSKRQTYVNRKTDKSRTATDYYLPLNNLDYEDLGDTQYLVGCSNTTQSTYIRLTFKIDESIFCLDHEVKSSGSYTLMDIISSGEDSIEEIIEEILEKGKKLEEVGIAHAEEDYSDYHIVAINEVLSSFDFDIEKRELVNSLIGIEIYKYDMKIND